jgi:hypothetical protein
MSYWHINEKNCQLANANTQKPLWLEGKIGPIVINRDKCHFKLEE